MIDRFEGSFRWLSNFYTCDVPYEGLTYPSAEHAYVAAKTLDEATRVQIREIETPAWVKKFGRNLALREDWDAIKIQEMHTIVYSKFTHNAWLRDKLLDTAPHELVEGNWWNDRFWGRDLAGYGSNHLGRILMEVRATLQNS
jgi:ribA/ribD-fused uncharacterized protein